MQVKWDQERCCHAGVCVGLLPDVFKIEDGRFVIDTNEASEEAIKNVVDRCPSGALQWVDE
ncbi:(4Fe-4S)-binding protein [Candidatus Methylomicrobium oryzae]|jgi:uncharacterized Fe-S cluster protein YjdI|uniref:(4Fe-4S)-binding protein n=1 Tax=Candidatus Methylomicrobium oryzae TaxID=2802053 RepID=UPI001921BAA5|nr:(4Fe-4S)-binding protein [Methylomicrobium sp. RS1]MBL1265779.1 (4Fe-4S)-binding protein [Methylomicrobium sp. RS1]